MSDDYTELDGTETAVTARTSINNTSRALRSLHSAANDTGFTKVAYMLWYDTANSLLKIRNSSNSAWVTIGELDTTNGDFNHIVGDFHVEQSSNDLVFKHNNSGTKTTIMKLTSAGALICKDDVTAYGTL